MKYLKRVTGFIAMCMMMILMAGAVWAAETQNTEGGEISSFNNYGENGSYNSLGEYEVAYGADITEVTSKLPSTLTAKLTTGEEVEVPVTWVCVSDSVGGMNYVPEHEDVTAVYVFEAQLPDNYTMAGNLPADYVMPFATVRYTEDAQMLNSAVDGNVTDTDTVAAAGGGMSLWTWIVWIVVIAAVVVVLWWLFAGNKGNGKDDDQV